MSMNLGPHAFFIVAAYAASMVGESVAAWYWQFYQ